GLGLLMEGILSGSSAAHLTIAGPGSIGLYGANTYAGGTELDQGNLGVLDRGLGTGPLALNGGVFNGLSSAGTTVANPFTVRGPAAIGNFTVDLNLTGQGTLLAGNTLTVKNSFTTVTISGTLTGGGALAKDPNDNSPGTLLLSGSNTYTGGTT